MSTIVKAIGNDGTEYFYGPFHDGDQATHWSYDNLKGFEWSWYDLSRPGSTYYTFSTCHVDDLKDFVEGAMETRQVDQIYVSIDDVNWCVIK